MTGFICPGIKWAKIGQKVLKEPKFNLSNIKEDNNILKENNYNKSVLKIPDSEINLHKEFLKKQLKKNYY